MNKKWTDAEHVELIDIYNETEDERKVLTDGHGTDHAYWKIVAHRMSAGGFDRTGEACRKRVATITAIQSKEQEPGSDCDAAERMRIVAVDSRGLTYVGKCKRPEDCKDGEWLTIHEARCVIRWGTPGEHMAGLVHGPTNKTRLGRPATVSVNPDACRVYYDVEGWE